MSSTAGVQVEGLRFDFAAAHHDRGSTAGYTHGDLGNSWFQGGLPTPPGTRDMTGLSLGATFPSFSANTSFAIGNPGNGRSASHTRVVSDPYSSQPGSRKTSGLDVNQIEQPSSNIASHLQIPDSVNSSKGSLAEFAAEITCLFWFETATTLDYAANLPVHVQPDRGLVPDATPSLGFRKWVTTMLSTTQVGKNVILLALMFVYRLKRFNPSVSGKRGSEFRLLTIALMLGNKFLDDNTYTNKTWAEVSGISVAEIHIMEVEFLSNMRYELYASKEDWTEWKLLLGRFGCYYEKAARYHIQTSPQSNAPVTPTGQTFGYKLPSPPSKHSSHPPFNYNLPNPMTTLPQLPRSPSRAPSQYTVPYDRKRSLDSSELLPPAKRLYQPQSYSNANSPATLGPRAAASRDTNLPVTNIPPELFAAARIPQLPMPRLPTCKPDVSTQLAPLTLPARASGATFPATAPAWAQTMTPMSAVPATVAGQYQITRSPVFVDAVRSQNGTGSVHTSPVNMYGATTPARPGLSPSYFLNNRSSPYRPVRNVHTLLIPPPATAMHNPSKNIAFEHMQYQLLGRPLTERQPGHVPFYVPEGHQSSTVSTPITQFRPY